MPFLGAQEALKKKHKLRKYTPHDFKDYINFEKDLAQRKAQFAELESSADPEQLKLLKECFEKIDESAEKWLDGLDQGLPKQLAKVGKFLKDAKQELKYATEETDDSRMEKNYIIFIFLYNIKHICIWFRPTKKLPTLFYFEMIICKRNTKIRLSKLFSPY